MRISRSRGSAGSSRLVGGPAARRIRRRGQAELELRVGEQDPAPRRDGRAVPIQPQRPVADRLGQRAGSVDVPVGQPRRDVLDHPVEGDVLVVGARFGLRRRA